MTLSREKNVRTVDVLAEGGWSEEDCVDGAWEWEVGCSMGVLEGA